MSSISSPGIGSGLDVNSIVSQMMAIEKRPLQLLQSKVSNIETKISSYGQIKSALSALYDAANGLMNSSTWQSKQFSSSDKAVVTGTATTATVAGSFAIQVDALASNQSLASGSFASGSAMGTAGQLTLQTGRWNGAGTSFAGSGSAVNISIEATDTLADIAGKINGSDAGVSAVVVKGTTGDQLLVRSSKSGEENGFAISVEENGGPALPGSTFNKLAYDPLSIAAGQAGMVRTMSAQDASFSINGIQVASASNTVADAVPGLTLNLLKTSVSPVEVSVDTDKAAARTKVEGFQQAYNKLNALLADLTRYDQATNKAQPLQGDNTATGLRNTLRGLLGQPDASGTYFASLGLELQQDGSLSINATKLDTALTDLPKLEQTLTASSGNALTDGLVTRIRDFAFTANGVAGDITGRSKALEASKKRNLSDQEAMSMRLEQRQQNMLKQYQLLDVKLGTMSSLSSFMAAQVSQWNKS